jgi:predicted metalloendopeptidase
MTSPLGTGNLNSWWLAETRTKFEERTSCLVDQYSKFSLNGDHVNGKLTLGENIADNGGVHLALEAYYTYAKAHPPTEAETACSKAPGTGEALSVEKLFFLGFAQVWCQKMRPEASRQQILTDPHSPGFARVNGAVANAPAFTKAFSCSEPDRQRCSVW